LVAFPLAAPRVEAVLSHRQAPGVRSAAKPAAPAGTTAPAR
jgi:hypothetical protein